jgi:hypothetical protein
LEPYQPPPAAGPTFVEVAKRKASKVAKIPPDSASTIAGSITKGEGALPPSGSVVWVKKPPSRGSTSNEIWIRNSLVPEMIGHGGKYQRSLIRKSGATTIYAFQDKLDSHGWCPIKIYGDGTAFQKVVELLEKRLGHKLKKPNVPAPARPGSTKFKPQQEADFGQVICKKLWISNHDVPELIGPEGRNIQALKTKSGVVSISAWQEFAEDGMCPVDIKGTAKCVQKAARYIELLFDGWYKEEETVAVTMPQEPLHHRLRSPARLRPGKGQHRLLPMEDKWEDGSSSSRSASLILPPVQPPAHVVGVSTPSTINFDTSQPRATNNQRGESPMVYTFNHDRLPTADEKLDKMLSTRRTPQLGIRGLEVIEPSTSAMGNQPEPAQFQHGPPPPPPSGSAVVAFPLPFIIPPVAAAAAAAAGSGTCKNHVQKDEDTFSLRTFLEQHASFFSCPPTQFHTWLQSEGIECLADLAEALEDEEYVQMELKSHGLKYFKRMAFKKAIAVSLFLQQELQNDQQHKGPSSSSSSSLSSGPTPPTELMCPIRHVLMINNPVVALDGYTYERDSIEGWFSACHHQQAQRQEPGIVQSSRAMSMITSPMTGEVLVGPTLIPNAHIRTLARDWARLHHLHREDC